MRSVFGFGGFVVVAALYGCGGSDTAHSTSDHAGSGGTAGSGATSGGGATTGGAAGRSTGGMAGAGGAGTGGTSATSGPAAHFGHPTIQPDTSTAPVASCAGAPDMALCNVVTTPDRGYDICVAGTCVSPGCGDTTCNAPSPHFAIPPNSQHTFFERQAGDEPIVVDLITGLGWQGCSSGLSGNDCKTGMYADMAWPDAVAYCDSLTWGGKSDWYLPDSYEALTLMDYAQGASFGTAMDPAIFPNADSGRTVWTSHVPRAETAMAVQYAPAATFATDPLFTDPKEQSFSVRCVRRGFSRDAGYTTTRYAESSGQTVVTDHATGLMWQHCVDGVSGSDCSMGMVNLRAASEWAPHCDSLSWGGFDDWRLPTYKELTSLSEYPRVKNRYESKVNDLFLGVDNYPYFGATSGWDTNAIPVLFDVTGGDKTGPNSAGMYPVICVRFGS